MVKEFIEWVKFELVGNMKVFEFIDFLQILKELFYLFDWSILIYVFDLVEELKIFKYFVGDFLQRIVLGLLYRDSWLSLFIVFKGLYSDFYVDVFGLNFWMVFFQGRKR